MLAALTFGLLQAQTQQSADGHQIGVNSRGDHAMGFSHERTTHHFRLYPDGGAIEVTANQSSDIDSRNMIRTHLSHITKMFAAGNFNTPMFIHDTVPPGATTMSELRDHIDYRYSDIPAGGRVRIHSSDPTAVAAVHDFLSFQITDHKTGDSPAITQDPAERH